MGASSQDKRRRFTPFPGTLAIQSVPASGGLRILAVGPQGDDAVNAALAEIKRWSQAEGIEAETASDLPTAIRKLSSGRWDLVLIGLGEQPLQELGWWTDALRASEGTPPIVAMIEWPSMSLVKEAEKCGVRDVLALPIRREDFLRICSRLQAAVEETALPLPPPESDAGGRYSLIGQHPTMVEIYKLIARVAKSSATVLIEGESGTGKECVAREIHASSARAARPFVAVNCAAIPENLLESALFGHEKGAFTGAVTRKLGRFEYAEGGTLFLDELADMSLSLQAKILRAVQEREVERVGSSAVIPVDVRLIGATNKDLRAAVEQGKFREDLYYRLAVVSMRLPRLADRGDDLFLLTACCVHEFGARHGKQIDKVSSRVLELLFNHEWVGNVRELRNVVERAVILANGDTLRSEHLPDEFGGARAIAPSNPAAGGALTLAEAERRHIALVLAQASGQIGAAAQTLGIHRNTLARKMKEFGL
jgi:DNA-binding NtrC family response regulator